VRFTSAIEGRTVETKVYSKLAEPKYGE